MTIQGTGRRRGATTHRRLRVPICLAALVLTIAMLAAASVASAATTSAPPSSSASPGSDTKTLRLGWVMGPDNLNPFIGFELASYQIWSLQYDTLFNPYADGSYGPQLALEVPTVENGGITDGGKVATVKIRSGVKWNDGKPLTAADVAFTYNYVLANDTSALYGLMKGIKKVEAPDATMVRIICSEPKADLTLTYMPVLPEHIWKDVTPNAANTSYQNKPPIVGSGPFQVTEVKKGVYVKMERNPDYWGTQPSVDEVVFQQHTDPDTMTQDLKMGTIDGAEDVPAAQFKALQNQPGITTVGWNMVNWDYLNLNCYEGKSLGNPVLRDRDFRRALATAVDTQKLTALAYQNLAAPGTTVIVLDFYSNPDYHWQAPADQLFTFSLEKAKQMLTDAGYADKNGDGIREGKDGKPIRIRLWARSDSMPGQNQGKLIAGWWKSLGLDIKYEVLDNGAIYDRFWNYEGDTFVPDFDVFVASTVGYFDPGQTLDWWRTEQIENWNEPCWSNAEYDKLWSEQSTTLDPEKRKELIWKLQEIMYGDAVTIVTAYPQYLQAYNTSKWEGWVPLKLAGGEGPVFASGVNVDTYLNIKPASQAGKSGGGSSTSLIIAAGVVALIAVGAILLIRRARARRAQTVEE